VQDDTDIRRLIDALETLLDVFEPIPQDEPLG